MRQGQPWLRGDCSVTCQLGKLCSTRKLRFGFCHMQNEGVQTHLAEAIRGFKKKKTFLRYLAWDLCDMYLVDGDYYILVFPTHFFMG